jgi:glyoxylate/hydroxypyruvate reductase A
MLNVLLSAPMFDTSPGFRSQIEEAAPGVRVAGEGDLADQDVDILIADDHTDPTGRRFPRLTAVLSLSAGVDRLLQHGQFGQVGIGRLLTPEHQQSMRDYIAYHVLRANGPFRAAERQQRERRWDWLEPATPVAGKSALVLGTGFLGAAAAATLRDLGLAVTGWSRAARPLPGIASIAGEDALRDALGDTDFLICLLPLTAMTRNLLDTARLRRLPDRAVLINASRAGCLDLPALVAMLRSGRLAGAVLDVLEGEPLAADSPLWTVPNLTLTPHCAAVPSAAAYLTAIVEALRAILAGRDLPNRIDKSQGY